MDLGLEGKVALVSGSSRGIGRAIALAFLREGASVLLTGRDPATLEEARAELAVTGGDRVQMWSGDVVADEGAAASVAAATSHFGGLDAVVANVGDGSGARGLDVEQGAFEAALETNLLGALRLARAAAPALQGRAGASLTFIGSIAGVDALDAPVAYGAAKAGLAHAARQLARSLGPAVRVNVVAPGNVLTTGGVWEQRLAEDAESVERLLEAEVPLRRFGTAEEIADAVLFLASARASFVTGACLVVDGGQTR